MNASSTIIFESPNASSILLISIRIFQLLNICADLFYQITSNQACISPVLLPLETQASINIFVGTFK